MKRIFMFFVVVLALTIPAGTILADPYFDTVVEENETINNDVIVFDGDLEIQTGGVVNGDVVVFNGDAEIFGTINGDLVIFNGDLDAHGQASINGDCVLLNGDVGDESTSGIQCTNIEGTSLSGITQSIPAVPAVPQIPDAPPVPKPPVFEHSENIGSPIIDFVRTIGSSLLLGLLAFGVVSAFPGQMNQVKATIRKKPVASGAVGVLTAVAVPSIAVLLAIISAVLTIICIGLLGFPIIMVLMLGFVVAIVMGWIAIGSWLGGRLFRNDKWSPAVTAAIGTMILTFGLGLLGILTGEWLQIILSTVLTSVGLGAVALTKFGRQPYPPADEEISIQEDEDKISVVLGTLPDDDPGQPIKNA